MTAAALCAVAGGRRQGTRATEIERRAKKETKPKTRAVIADLVSSLAHRCAIDRLQNLQPCRSILASPFVLRTIELDSQSLTASTLQPALRASCPHSSMPFDDQPTQRPSDQELVGRCAVAAIRLTIDPRPFKLFVSGLLFCLTSTFVIKNCISESVMRNRGKQLRGQLGDCHATRHGGWRKQLRHIISHAEAPFFFSCRFFCMLKARVRESCGAR